MRKIILSAFFMLVAVTIQAQEEVKWLGFEEALALNEKNPKPILVDLYTDWCGWCKRMDKDTYANEIIAKYINANFYAVKMDGEGREDITYKNKTFKFVQYNDPVTGKPGKYHELAAAIMKGKMSYPSTAFFDKSNQLVQVQGGYLKAPQFEKILAFFKTESYKNTPWATFEKDFKSAL